ncbi:10106_t:CDS:2 [Dentiscutata erythropus]|uniref:10106_t:CDS:1 n=1 Tax=Dentiscutata erythropus TaxID=1348616 RepID=A0A9N9JIK4_9GLOM|nr:10106_t:CDS:2 [Dentiscutata erythropus]
MRLSMTSRMLSKKKTHPQFENFASFELTLWKVNISFDSPNDKRNALEADPKADITTKLGGEELSSLDSINEHFDKPVKKHVNVIVEVPASFTPPYYYITQDAITKIHEIHNKLFHQTIETLSISKINTETYQLLMNHLKLKIETADFDNILIHSNVSSPAFEWKDESELAHKDEYLGWLRDNNLLNLYKNPLLPFNVHGGTDIVAVDEGGVAIDLVPESIYAVLQLKKKIERKHMMQVVLEMVVADIFTSDRRTVFGILSDLRNDWRIYWLESDRKIKAWKAPSRDIAVYVISTLLCESSSKDNREDTLPIIPAAKRVKLVTLFQMDEDYDIARMEDVYDVMSKEEILHHKIGIAVEMIKNTPSFSSMFE